MTVEGVLFFMCWRIINCRLSHFSNRDCGGNNNKQKKRKSPRLSSLSLSLHNFAPFGLQIKGLWNWCPEDVHCWDDGATMQTESVVYQTCQLAERGERRGWERPGCRFNTPNLRNLKLLAVAKSVSLQYASSRHLWYKSWRGGGGEVLLNMGDNRA